MFATVQKLSLSEAVFTQLRERILNRELAAGDALPSERLLGEMLGVNRGAVREGLKRLQQSGLVEVRHGGATRVLDYADTAGLELLPSLLVDEDAHMRVEVARGILSLRESLAPTVARQAAQKQNLKIASELEQIVGRMRQSSELADLQDQAFEFWGVLVRGSGNIAFRLAYNSLGQTYRKIWGLLTQVMAEEFRDLERLAALAASVRAGDASRAERLAREHVALGTQALERVLAAYSGQSRIDLGKVSGP